MDLKRNWLISFNQEIQQAENARSVGNEGMARVCARRAAGAVVGEYLRRQKAPLNTPSSYNLIQTLLDQPDTPAEVKACARRLLMRVGPDHKLPVDADLIADARWLRETLL